MKKQTEELTDEQIAQEEEFMRGIPRINIGALFLPPIWGPGHGNMLTILFYPLWLFADNLIYAAVMHTSVMSVIFGVIAFVVLVGITVAFSLVSQPSAWHRAYDRGKTKEEFLATERKWAIACVIVGIIMIAAATYYNLAIRPGISW